MCIMLRRQKHTSRYISWIGNSTGSYRLIRQKKKPISLICDVLTILKATYRKWLGIENQRGISTTCFFLRYKPIGASPRRYYVGASSRQYYEDGISTNGII